VDGLTNALLSPAKMGQRAQRYRPRAQLRSQSGQRYRLPSARLWGKPSCRVSPMTDDKVLAIILACYGVVLLAMVYLVSHFDALVTWA